jgi:spore coat polysaccharide biosynthesis protein SpsF
MRVVIIDQARMGSTRLPGKILKEVMGKSLLEYQIERLRRVTLADEVVIATTVNDADQPIVDLCEKLAVPCFRGSEEDVLSRYYHAARVYGADVVVRVTSDCPVIDPAVPDHILSAYLADPDQYDFVSNTLVRTYPRGMDTEVFPFRVLQEAYRESVSSGEREEVSPFIHQRPQRYRLFNIAYASDQSYHRWTVDTSADFDLISRIIEELYPHDHLFSLEDILQLMFLHPELPMINSQVEHKETWKIEYNKSNLFT